jgi:L-ornithine N5-oxygenase
VKRQHVGLLAVGAGPANLALAVALEELAPAQISQDALILEQHDDILWQRGMLLPGTQAQVSFLKDLVTLRNPRSRFTFLNYLHSAGRLDEFINLSSFTPYRQEISDYLQWVAASLRDVRITFGRTCVSIEPIRSGTSEVREWLAQLADGDQIICRDVVIGVGREPFIPPALSSLPRERVIHSTEYSSRTADIDTDAAPRIVVIGGAQSAAEMLWTTHQRLRRAQCTMVMRSIGLNSYEASKFTNELFYPSMVDEFHGAVPEARDQLLVEMHRSNYSGLNPETLDNLYREMYLERLTGKRRLQMITMTEVTSARMQGSEVVLVLTDRKTRRTKEVSCDLVMLGTGFVKTMPRLVRALAAASGVDEIAVTRNYRLKLPPEFTASCYLQGVNEATHGIADSLLSVLAIRSGEIVRDILEHRLVSELALSVPSARTPIS